MVELAHAIELELGERLRDPDFRAKFFVAETSARIAAQIIALRKKRGLSQKELAERIGTGQPAISRAERADYNNWSFNTLRSIAHQLDARIRVIIEPSEDILAEYEETSVLRRDSIEPLATGIEGAKCLETVRGAANSKAPLSYLAIV